MTITDVQTTDIVQPRKYGLPGPGSGSQGVLGATDKAVKVSATFLLTECMHLKGLCYY
jgi:hypothetical protein